MTTGTSENLSDVWDRLLEETNGDETTLGDLFDALGTRSFGPLLLLPALVALSPVGAVPGMSIVTGSLIILISVQALLGRDHPWLPERLLAFSFSREHLERANETLRPWLTWVERFISHRLQAFVRPPTVSVVALLCTLLAISFYPLALLPFAVAVPAFAVTLFAVGLTAGDGALIVAGGVITGIAAWLLYSYWPL